MGRADLTATLDERIRVLRVIARMNVGGPAYHVSVLSGRLDPARYRTVLVTGRVTEHEASFDELAAREGVTARVVPSLGPQISPARDLRALVALVRTVREFRPQIVHTHTAKAGMLARVAALAIRPRPVIVHTYHGHVLEKYFGPSKSCVFTAIERLLARVSDCLIGVSEATVADLVRLGVAGPDKFRVIRLGLDLEPFLAIRSVHGAFRAELGLEPTDVLVTFIGRLVAIKRVDLLLDAVAVARKRDPRIRVAIVGDGERRDELRLRAAQLGLEGAVHFIGYRKDLAAILADTDIVMLTSDNEGTPVSIIEAAAAGRPAVATAVGGVSEVVSEQTGCLAPAGDVGRLAQLVGELAANPDQRTRLGQAAREHVRSRFSAARLVDDVDGLYRELLRSRTPSASAV